MIVQNTNTTDLFLILATYKLNMTDIPVNNIQNELDEHNSDMGNMQTELAERNRDMDNMQTEFEECITDLGDARTELMGDMDNIQNELDKYIFDNKSNWNLFPNKMWLKIIRAVLQQCDFKVNHRCFTFTTLNLVNKIFKELTQKCKDNLQRMTEIQNCFQNQKVENILLASKA